jgi:hypothetical protein
MMNIDHSEFRDAEYPFSNIAVPKTDPQVCICLYKKIACDFGVNSRSYEKGDLINPANFFNIPEWHGFVYVFRVPFPHPDPIDRTYQPYHPCFFDDSNESLAFADSTSFIEDHHGDLTVFIATQVRKVM